MPFGGTVALAGPMPFPAEAAGFSRFERWPGWLFYAPIVAHWIWHGLRAGDMTLPTAANPGSKRAGCAAKASRPSWTACARSRGLIAPYATFVTGNADTAVAEQIQARFGWPLVVKPDIGCNGTGVRLVGNRARLEQTVAAFPRGVRLLLQAFAAGPGEAGIFYIRHPHEAHGRITSLTLKTSPSVLGDGRSTLRALLMAHPRAGRTPGLFLPHWATG